LIVPDCGQYFRFPIISPSYQALSHRDLDVYQGKNGLIKKWKMSFSNCNNDEKCIAICNASFRKTQFKKSENISGAAQCAHKIIFNAFTSSCIYLLIHD